MGVLLGTIAAANAQTSGTCGETDADCHWSYNTSSKVLTISGTGAMTNYSSSTNAPWYSYRSEMTSVSITGVTSIGNYAFNYCSGLTTGALTLPNSVISIGNSAFYGCSSLTSITLNSVTSIDDDAFYGCGLTGTLTLPNVISIGDGAFRDCSGLTGALTLPNVISIGDGAFYGCSGLTGALTLPNVISIGGGAFRACTALPSVTIPNSVTSIGDAAFYNCTELTSVTIGNSVTYIGTYAFDGTAWYNNKPDGGVVYIGNWLYSYKGTMPSGTAITVQTGTVGIVDYAFSGCSGLTSVTIPNSVTSIGNYAFSGCSGLTSVSIPNSVTSIGNWAFCNCTGLTSVTIGNSVTYIGNYAFSGCSGLTSVTIPNSVTSIGYSAFEGCTGIKKLTIEDGTDALSFGTNSLTNVAPDTLYLGRTISGISSSNRFGTALKQVTIGNSVTSIPEYAFYNCTGIKKFTIKATTTPLTFEGSGTTFSFDTLYLGRNVSSRFGVALKQVTIGDSVTSIPQRAFGGCTGLTSVTIPNSVTSIGNNAFRGCTGLTGTLTIPNSVTSIGDEAFYNCTELTSVSIGNSVTSIGDYAFEGCSGLTGALTIPNSVISIGNRAFRDCAELTSVSIGNSVISIGDEAFRGCAELTSVSIGNSVTSISNSAFSGCTGLTAINVDDANTTYSSVDGVLFNEAQTTLVQYPVGKQGAYTIPNSVTSIGTEAFYYRTGLTGALTLPAGLTSIGNSAFSNCTGLTGALTLPASLTSIGTYAFYYCTGLTGALTLPASLTSIGTYAFYNCTGLTGALTLPASLTSIGTYAFYNCNSISSIINHNPTPVPVNIANVFSVDKSTCPLTVPIGYCNVYAQANVWKDFPLVCQNRVYFVSEGVKIDSADVDHGSAVVQPAAPTRTGYIFDGWYNGASAYNFSTAVTANLTLTAHWTAVVIPSITAQPQSSTVNIGGNVNLSVTATVSDGGTLSYQWYSNTTYSNNGGTAVSGVTSTTYAPPTATAGTFYYYVVITNTKNGSTATRTSSAVQVAVLANAVTPTITVQPQGSTVNIYDYVYLSVTANASDGGNLTCQWYSNTVNSNTGGSSVGAGSSYTPSTTTAGTLYYYVVVTNTKNGTTATTTSNVATVTVNAATPSITASPQSSTVPVNGSASLSVTAEVSDGGTLTYQWYSNTNYNNDGGTAVSGATSATYAPPTATVGTFYYYVVITNTKNGITATTKSGAVQVTVLANAVAPTITAHPQDDTVNMYAAAYLRVTANASDGGTLSYQWYSNTTNSNSGGTAISGTSVASNVSGVFYYYVVVTNNKNGTTATATSNVATVVVNPRTPDISYPQGGGTVLIGGSVSLSVTAEVNDGGTLSYQWYSNTTYSNTGGTAVSGATSTTYAPSTATAGMFYYYVVVTNTKNGTTATATSNVAEVRVNVQTPIITAHPPQSSTVLVGGSVSLSVTATVTDGSALSYQWYSSDDINNKYTGTAVSGATSATYAPSTATTGEFYYYVVVTNTSNGMTATATSNVAHVRVTVQTPSITTQPQGNTVNVGGSVNLSVTANVTDGGTLSYQWYSTTVYFNCCGTAVSGATSATYAPSTATAGSFHYYVIITNNANNGFSGIVSNLVVVTVTAAGAAVTDVSLNKPTLSLAVGANETLTATVLPATATNKAVTWSSSNTGVATVSASGVVTGKTAGSATITVTTQDGSKTATCTVTVTPAGIAVTGVSLDRNTLSLAPAATQQLTATITPSNATNKNITWASSNTSVATVAADGRVTAKAAGTATITVTTQDGSKTTTCAVTVSTTGGNGDGGKDPATAVATQNVSSLFVYPNPVSDQLTVSSDQWNAVGAGSARPSIEIYNVAGTKVFETPLSIVHYPLSINIGHLPAGIYIVRVGNRTAKVVKQ
ncbi:hypothetical protein FACS189456_3730 [Bacteroidia bacterium]|nr:hypothetical protein FACS189456_3730 [Bacteroidia bacterium]